MLAAVLELAACIAVKIVGEAYFSIEVFLPIHLPLVDLGITGRPYTLIAVDKVQVNLAKTLIA